LKTENFMILKQLFMKQLISGITVLFFSISSFANEKDSTINYNLPDSVKAVSFLVEVSVGTIITKKEDLQGSKPML